MRRVITYIRMDGQNPLVTNENIKVDVDDRPGFYYTFEEEHILRPMHRDGSPFALSEISGFDAIEWGVDDDWDKDTPVAMLTNTGIIVEEVTENSVTYAQFRILTDADTEKVEIILDDERINKKCYAQLNAYIAGKKEFVMQYPILLFNNLLTPGTPSGNINLYYTKIEITALLASITAQVASNSADITTNANAISANSADITTNANAISANSADIVTLQNTPSGMTIAEVTAIAQEQAIIFGSI